MEDSNDTLYFRNILNEDTENLVVALKNSEDWINDGIDNKLCLNAYNIIWGIRDNLNSIINTLKGNGVTRDDQLSEVGAKIAEPLIDLIYKSMRSNNINAIEFSVECTVILFMIKPYLNEVTLKRCGGLLYKTSSLCSSKLKAMRNGKDVESELIQPYLTISGFYSTYMNT